MTTIEPTAIPAKIIDTTKLAEPNFGNGRFSAEMLRLYKSAIDLFGFTPQAAEKFARQAASDAGDFLKNATASLKIGKTNSDGKATISDAAKAKGVTLTNSLNVARAIQWIGDAGSNGVSFGFTDWRLSDKLQKYADMLEAEVK